MTVIKSCDDVGFTGAIKISHVRYQTNRGIKGGHFQQIMINGVPVLIVNLGRRVLYVKGCDE